MAPQSENGTPNQFLPFNRLPAELQLMIWAFWRADQPMIHHYLMLGLKGQRYYTALNTKKRAIVRTTAQSADPKVNNYLPLDPCEFKIQFTGSVMAITDRNTVHRLANGSNLRSRFKPQNGRFATWANFEKDIFFIGSNYKFPGQLRFLFHGIGARIPRVIRENQWCCRIRQLAMYASRGTEGNFRSTLDRNALSQLTSLRKVFLIVTTVFAAFDAHTHRMKPCGLQRLGDYIRDNPDRTVSPHLEPMANVIRADLEDIFSNENRDYIDVDVMVDVW